MTAPAPHTNRPLRSLLPALASATIVFTACARPEPHRPTVTISASALGAEGTLLTRQLVRFGAQHPGIDVRLQPTPDDATQRHQLYVQWLNARAADPDIVQLDAIWTAEFAAAGWILPLDPFKPDTAAFFPAALDANRWDGELFALPWFVDVGLLYWRTDLIPREPRSLNELVRLALAGMGGPRAPPFGIVWQGARYEGLVTVFLEYLGGFGGEIIDTTGRAVVDSPEGIRALAFMRDALYRHEITPLDVLSWHEEESRFAFQNGNAVFMRNWPYAAALLSDSGESRVAGKFAVAPMPAAQGGAPTAALGGAQLAINARAEFPDSVYALVAFLTAAEQMLERASAVGQYPARRALYDDSRLRDALPVPVDQARRAVERATPRPVTPIYTQLSEILQIELHRALARQISPEQALARAATQMNEAIESSGLANRRDRSP